MGGGVAKILDALVVGTVDGAWGYLTYAVVHYPYIVCKKQGAIVDFHMLYFGVGVVDIVTLV